MILDQLVQASQQRVQKVPVRERVKRIQQARKMTTPALSFEAMLAQPGLQLIGEVKRASPSKGLIAAEFDYLQIAQDYVAAGIDAISVLTEPRYFKGQLSYLQAIAQTVSVPTLRKDFIVAASQIASARIAGASAVLLIVAILTPVQLQAFITLAHELNLSALVEVHTTAEIKQAVAAGARIIGINNRNLKDFSVNFATSCQLRQAVPAECYVVAESGIQTATQAQQLAAAGFDAMLVGETLMRAPDKGQAVMQLRAGVRG
ncbi:indole-3-glycerol phosphate synthase [Lactiplantibacillus plantarum]|uniref:indole-3-glycerol phosphate synthase TrpC n=1 Tax=Lactiplantibacillus plantarum TaxID=1590 RepID=UPI0007BBF18B|nr:indole-3-glycerol phosphate synthase TrpC [Lactiplantibacillus plantarum]AYE60246.1 indole-3-glycerol phosphate synthase [Lactiplantibacillus plantarum]KZU52446.1 Indole-3-glycerol phosphate synthase [Lactiplantibacillus plantarum]QBJ55310.1 indole-3-glycerol phosphate synthase TrpC [Lactiplantibacillus plantarum]RDG28328.1 indole-3-glycerol phosphate synthase TrpC [Lactiplantibacillus plantarum]